METTGYNGRFWNHFSSYPTYEEWKQTIKSEALLGLRGTVLILPMRNGNLNNQKKMLISNHIVLILPMRNGNPSWYIFSHAEYMFLSYLWGMETFLEKYIIDIKQKRSYPTYEEWKLI